MILWLNKLHCGLMLELFTGSGAWAWWDSCVILVEYPQVGAYMWLGPQILVPMSKCCPHLSVTPSGQAAGLLLLFCHFTSVSFHPLGPL